MLVAHPAAAHVLVGAVTGRATRVSPWQDNLRHMYEANVPGRDLETLAKYSGIGKGTAKRLIIESGGKIRKPGGRKYA